MIDAGRYKADRRWLVLISSIGLESHLCCCEVSPPHLRSVRAADQDVARHPFKRHVRFEVSAVLKANRSVRFRDSTGSIGRDEDRLSVPSARFTGVPYTSNEATFS